MPVIHLSSDATYYYCPEVDETVDITLGETLQNTLQEIQDSPSYRSDANETLLQLVRANEGTVMQAKIIPSDDSSILLKLEDSVIRVIKNDSQLEILEVSDPQFNVFVGSIFDANDLGLQVWNPEESLILSVLEGEL